MSPLWGHFVGVLILVMMATFIGIWIWAWSSRHRHTFSKMARLPMDDNHDDGAPVTQVQEETSP